MVGVSWHALVGGEGAPDLTESLLNLSINSAALAGFSFLLFRDLQGAEKDRKVVDREELLGRLLVSLTPIPSFTSTGHRPALLLQGRFGTNGMCYDGRT